MLRLFFRSFFIFFLLISSSQNLFAEIVNKIEIDGNSRISSETIKMFTGVSINDDLSENDLNQILKNLYDSNFFENVSVKIENNILTINVKENPIIQNLNYEGIKSDKLLSDLKSNVILKSRSSFDEVTLKKDEKKNKSIFKGIRVLFCRD